MSSEKAPDAVPVLIQKVKEKKQIEKADVADEKNKREAREHVKKSTRADREALKKTIAEYRAHDPLKEHVKEAHVDPALKEIEQAIDEPETPAAPTINQYNPLADAKTEDELKRDEAGKGTFAKLFESESIAKLVGTLTRLWNSFSIFGGKSEEDKAKAKMALSFYEEKFAKTDISASINKAIENTPTLNGKVVLVPGRGDEKATAALIDEWKKEGGKTPLLQYAVEKLDAFERDNADAIKAQTKLPITMQSLVGKNKLNIVRATA